MTNVFDFRARRVLLAVMAVAALGTMSNTQAQGFPDKPVKLNVGFPPGTGRGLLARLVGQRSGELLKQSVIVDNKPDAGAQIASQQVAKRAPDGYNLLLAEAGSISIAPAAFLKLPYDPSRELVGVADLSAWLGVLAPAGTPAPALDLLNKRFVEAVQSVEVRQTLLEAGFTVTGTSRTETDRMLKAEAGRWGRSGQEHRLPRRLSVAAPRGND